MPHDTAHGVIQFPVIQASITRVRLVWRTYVGSLVLAVMVALLGCSGDEPALTGTWTGTITDNLAGVGSLLFTISQTGNQLTGTWQSTFPDSTNNGGGTLSGTINDSSIALTLAAAQPRACSFTVAATRDNDHHFSGTYVALNCTRVENGTLEVNRQ
jgi:hypothetical protein